MIRKILFLSLGALVFFPNVSNAQIGLKELIIDAGYIINLLIPIAASLALLYFFWGLAKFVWNSGSEDGVEEGRQVMKWGIVALFVIVSIWGIVFFIQEQLNIDSYLLEPGDYPYASPYSPNDQCNPLLVDNCA